MAFVIFGVLTLCIWENLNGFSGKHCKHFSFNCFEQCPSVAENQSFLSAPSMEFKQTRLVPRLLRIKEKGGEREGRAKKRYWFKHVLAQISLNSLIRLC